MKNIKFLLLIAFSFVLLNACSSDDNDKIPPVANNKLNLVKSFKVDNQVVEFYSTHKNFIVGYNPIEVMVKDVSTGEYFENVELNNFMPMMQMPEMMHSCPNSKMFKSFKNGGKASGFSVFIMPGNWKVNFTYTVNGKEHMVKNQEVMVTNPDRAMLAHGKGSDNVKYYIAYIEPIMPKIGLNTITTKVYKMKSMEDFPEVENYKILIDPRMPSMGHSSPNNENLVYQKDGLYKGKVNFTMTGYWEINLQLINEKGETILGNPIDKDRERSSIYWGIEF